MFRLSAIYRCIHTNHVSVYNIPYKNMAEEVEEVYPGAKRAKYSHCGGDLAVTEEMMKDFSRDGYIIVKYVSIV